MDPINDGVIVAIIAPIFTGRRGVPRNRVKLMKAYHARGDLAPSQVAVDAIPSPNRIACFWWYV